MSFETDHIQDDNQKWKLKEEAKNLRSWLTDVVFWYGVLQGRAEQADASATNRAFTLYNIDRTFGKMEFYWTIAYGCIDVNLSDNHDVYLAGLDIHGRKVNEYRLFRRGDHFRYGEEFVVKLGTATEEMVQRFLPDIRQRNSIRFCDSPVHLINTWDKRLPVTSFDRRFGICHPIGDKWLCEDCIDRYSLSYKPIVDDREKKTGQNERNKLTPSLRFTILERDEFTCRACGRSPLRGDAAKLHVDHIVPIASGGKTRESNLQTLCQDCNLGKGARTVNSMQS